MMSKIKAVSAGVLFSIAFILSASVHSVPWPQFSDYENYGGCTWSLTSWGAGGGGGVFRYNAVGSCSLGTQQLVIIRSLGAPGDYTITVVHQ